VKPHRNAVANHGWRHHCKKALCMQTPVPLKPPPKLLQNSKACRYERACWVRKFGLRGLEQDRACQAVPAIVPWELGCERVHEQDGVRVGRLERPPERQVEHHRQHVHPGVAADNPVLDKGEDCCIEGRGHKAARFCGLAHCFWKDEEVCSERHWSSDEEELGLRAP
jgi:hypothetical protein